VNVVLPMGRSTSLARSTPDSPHPEPHSRLRCSISKVEAITLPIDLELDPALEHEFNVEPPEPKARLDSEADQEF